MLPASWFAQPRLRSSSAFLGSAARMQQLFAYLTHRHVLVAAAGADGQQGRAKAALVRTTRFMHLAGPLALQLLQHVPAADVLPVVRHGANADAKESPAPLPKKTSDSDAPAEAKAGMPSMTKGEPVEWVEMADTERNELLAGLSGEDAASDTVLVAVMPFTSVLFDEFVQMLRDPAHEMFSLLHRCSVLDAMCLSLNSKMADQIATKLKQLMLQQVSGDAEVDPDEDDYKFVLWDFSMDADPHSGPGWSWASQLIGWRHKHMPRLPCGDVKEVPRGKVPSVANEESSQSKLIAKTACASDAWFWDLASISELEKGHLRLAAKVAGRLIDMAGFAPCTAAELKSLRSGQPPPDGRELEAFSYLDLSQAEFQGHCRALLGVLQFLRGNNHQHLLRTALQHMCRNPVFAHALVIEPDMFVDFLRHAWNDITLTTLTRTVHHCMRTEINNHILLGVELTDRTPMWLTLRHMRGLWPIAFREEDEARAVLDEFVGGYLGDLDLSDTIITGSAIAAATIITPHEWKLRQKGHKPSRGAHCVSGMCLQCLYPSMCTVPNSHQEYIRIITHFKYTAEFRQENHRILQLGANQARRHSTSLSGGWPWSWTSGPTGPSEEARRAQHRQTRSTESVPVSVEAKILMTSAQAVRGGDDSSLDETLLRIKKNKGGRSRSKKLPRPHRKRPSSSVWGEAVQSDASSDEKAGRDSPALSVASSLSEEDLAEPLSPPFPRLSDVASRRPDAVRRPPGEPRVRRAPPAEIPSPIIQRAPPTVIGGQIGESPIIQRAPPTAIGGQVGGVASEAGVSEARRQFQESHQRFMAQMQHRHATIMERMERVNADVKSTMHNATLAARAASRATNAAHVLAANVPPPTIRQFRIGGPHTQPSSNANQSQSQSHVAPSQRSNVSGILIEPATSSTTNQQYGGGLETQQDTQQSAHQEKEQDVLDQKSTEDREEKSRSRSRSLSKSRRRSNVSGRRRLPGRRARKARKSESPPHLDTHEPALPDTAMDPTQESAPDRADSPDLETQDAKHEASGSWSQPFTWAWAESDAQRRERALKEMVCLQPGETLQSFLDDSVRDLTWTWLETARMSACTFKLQLGADVQLMVRAADPAELEQIAVRHLVAIQRKWPSARLIKLRKANADQPRPLDDPDQPDHDEKKELQTGDGGVESVWYAVLDPCNLGRFRAVTIYAGKQSDVVRHPVGMTRGGYTVLPTCSKPCFFGSPSFVWSAIHAQSPNYYDRANRFSKDDKHPHEFLFKWKQRGFMWPKTIGEQSPAAVALQAWGNAFDNWKPYAADKKYHANNPANTNVGLFNVACVLSQ